ncbi:MAG: GTPase HflX [Candidatus Eisenbacteria bacterium]|nr:GTPase HflX [Candidatus Eisenbacteria bacterium]
MTPIHNTAEDNRSERAILIGLKGSNVRGSDDSLDELGLLVDTAGGTIVGTLMQRRESITPGAFLGKGKLEELKALVEDTSADVVVFDEDLSPGQVKNLEKTLQIKVVDRSEVILHIFALRARSREARVQVELAQLEYQLPRLTRLWKHLSRLGGGIGTRGPGETQLEVDRRRVRERIGTLKRQLAGVERERCVQRKQREDVFRVAIVGYTNAGKSTLFKALTGTDAFIEDRLFATVDARTRRLRSRRVPPIVVTDTVGFIRKLPHHLVTSFRATLEEVLQADLLIHVVDSSSPRAEEQLGIVESVLTEIGAGEKPAFVALNKMDVAEPEVVQSLKGKFSSATEISALKGQNLDSLIGRIVDTSRAQKSLASVEIPLAEEGLISYLRGSCEFVREKVVSDKIRILLWADQKEIGRLRRKGLTVLDRFPPAPAPRCESNS